MSFTKRNEAGIKFEKQLIEDYDVIRNEEYVDQFGFDHPDLKYPSGPHINRWRELYPDLYFKKKNIFLECKSKKKSKTWFKFKLKDLKRYKTFRDYYEVDVWVGFKMGKDKYYTQFTDEFIEFVESHYHEQNKELLRKEDYSEYYEVEIPRYGNFITEEELFT
tara:strand:+ start:53 stop:541 length:489 start_codon:yes stop_codon:yes gene_type:complete